MSCLPNDATPSISEMTAWCLGLRASKQLGHAGLPAVTSLVFLPCPVLRRGEIVCLLAVQDCVEALSLFGLG